MSGGLVWSAIAGALARGQPCALITVLETRGSSPREAGARMAVDAEGAIVGTIGGGALEFAALTRARSAIAAGVPGLTHETFSLGPRLGQCCGGQVRIAVEVIPPTMHADAVAFAAAETAGSFVTEAQVDRGRAVLRRRGPVTAEPSWLETDPATILIGDRLIERFGISRTPLLLFGAGHVGRATVLALAPLPFAVRWVDSRPGAFPCHVPATATCLDTADPAAEIAHAAPGSFVVIMTHDHALDLAVTLAALGRDDFGFIGLIGSATKAGRFRRRFTEAGVPSARIARLVCPLGMTDIVSKEPAVIAAGLAVQLLRAREARTAEAHLSRFAMVKETT